MFERADFWGSVVPTTPAVRGTDGEIDLPPGSGTWSAFHPDDPRYGEPGSLFGPQERDGGPAGG